MTEFDSLIVERDGPVLTVRVVPFEISLAREPVADLHRDLGLFFDGLRHAYDVRVVVLTGADDGEFIRPPSSVETNKRNMEKLGSIPSAQWATFAGLIHTHQTMVDLEIPIIAKVNGDAIGFGQSLMFACDLIVAREDAIICDYHLLADMVPGDGAGSLVPLYMPPTLAKEYLMLAPQKSAAELARAGIINRAVPATDLDATVDELVQALLARPQHALGWTKRIVNTRMKDHMLRSLDAAAAYEMISLMHLKNLGPDARQAERSDALADG